jgi:hypothetical protein
MSVSLDVYLLGPHGPSHHDAIFIREHGRRREITRAEWDQRHPDLEPYTVASGGDGTVYHGNITHNLSTMAEDAGLYTALWRPQKQGWRHASDLLNILAHGIDTLTREPERFKAMNPANGWGTYEVLVGFVEEYLQACAAYPDAEIRVSD